MHLLFKSVRIFQPESPYAMQVVDVEIRDGVIAAMGADLVAEGAVKITGKQLCMTTGFTDSYAFFRDPGFEYKEDLASGAAAAFRGGFTQVLVQPDTLPVIQTKGEVLAVRSKAAGLAPEILIAGALTEDLQGKHITEMLDMHEAGALAFSNADQPMSDTSAQLRALQYAQHLNALVMVLPLDHHLSKGGQVHEGLVSTRLGLKGIPSLAESMQVARDLSLLRYTGGRLHFSKISTAESVELIRAAKAEGLQVSCGVAAHHLWLTDEVLVGFDTNFKVMPPLRLATDREALRAGVLDGTIDVICSDHQPEDTEHKFVEFDLAKPGMAGIETAFALVAAAFNEKDLPQALTALNDRPRKLLGLPLPVLAPGETANLVVFDLEETQSIKKQHLRTKGVNNPFVEKTWKAPLLAVLRANHHYLSHEK